MAVPDPMFGSFPALRPRLLGVVDANAVLSSIDNECRTGRPSFLRRMSGRSVMLYASAHVYTELYERLPKFATGKAGSATLEELRACLEERYLPIIHFVHVTDDGDDDPAIAAIVDPDDKPTGRLAKLVAPCIVFSEDKHLRTPGYAPPSWRASARSAAEVARGDQMIEGTAMLTIAPPAGAHLLLRATARWLETRTIFLYGFGLGALGLYLLDPQRRTAFGTRLGKIGTAVMNTLEPILIAQEAALERLRPDIYHADGPRTLRQGVAGIVARARGPMSAEEIRVEFASGSMLAESPGLDRIESVLSDGSEFIKVISERVEWQFGRVALPWDGQYGRTD